MPPLIRAFVAVPCGEQLALELTRRLDGWRALSGLRCTDPATWHITLQFLGDWPVDRLERLKEALPDACRVPATELAPDGWGAFPNPQRPRVLFLQFADVGPLWDLSVQVRQATAAVWPEGPQDARPPHPHLTLARIRETLNERQVNDLQNIVLNNLPATTMDRFRLMASELRGGGPRHSILADFSLRKKGE